MRGWSGYAFSFDLASVRVVAATDAKSVAGSRAGWKRCAAFSAFFGFSRIETDRWIVDAYNAAPIEQKIQRNVHTASGCNARTSLGMQRARWLCSATYAPVLGCSIRTSFGAVSASHRVRVQRTCREGTASASRGDAIHVMKGWRPCHEEAAIMSLLTRRTYRIRSSEYDALGRCAVGANDRCAAFVAMDAARKRTGYGRWRERAGNERRSRACSVEGRKRGIPHGARKQR